MWLIDVSSITLKEFAGPNIPPYGILSHTWEGGEVSYQEMRDGAGRSKEGYNKIKMTCKLAAAYGLAYAWVDTCCIDKSSSTELTEAINSMFQWYKHAAICYVYLSDLEPSADISTALKNCRWFKRGWTLQELIAPYEVEFFDQNWYPRGSKKHLLDEISTVTGISSAVLTHASPLSSVTVATRMSWVANRETTREEDIGYCLLGIFDVNMPLLYGEGPNAFRRLQEEIIKSTYDLSIFAWKAGPGLNGQHAPRYSGILAESPKEFWSCRRLIKAKESTFQADFSVTNRGIRMRTCLISLPLENSQGWMYVQDIGCSMEDDEHSLLAICLRKCGADLFVRCEPSSLATIPQGRYKFFLSRTIYILSKLPEIPPLPQHQLLQREGDFIIGSRVSAVQIRFPRCFQAFNAHPMSHYDSQDGVFFSTISASDSWCFMTLEGKIALNGRRMNVSCIFLCIGWNRRSDKVVSTIVDKSRCDPTLMPQFISGLEHEQDDALPWIIKDLEHFSIPLQNSVTFKKSSETVTISHTIQKVFLPNICNNEMYRVDITLVENLRLAML